MKRLLTLLLIPLLFSCGDDIKSKLDCPFPEYSQEVIEDGKVLCVLCFDTESGYLDWFDDCAIYTTTKKEFCKCYN